MKKQSGFSIIEIIVTISLLLLVATLIFPKFAGITDKQKIKLDIATAHELANLARISYIDNGEKAINEENFKKIINENYASVPKSKYNNSEFTVTINSAGKAKVSIGNVVLVDDSSGEIDSSTIINSLTKSND